MKILPIALNTNFAINKTNKINDIKHKIPQGLNILNADVVNFSGRTKSPKEFFAYDENGKIVQELEFEKSKDSSTLTIFNCNIMGGIDSRLKLDFTEGKKPGVSYVYDKFGDDKITQVEVECDHNGFKRIHSSFCPRVADIREAAIPYQTSKGCWEDQLIEMSKILTKALDAAEKNSVGFPLEPHKEYFNHVFGSYIK